MIEPGSKFGNYRIIRQLGAGGMSDVFEATDLTLERHVALKIMPPDFSQDEERIKRFRKEVRAVAALDHPGIVTIFEVNQAEGCDYYTMTLARHGNLKQLIHKGSLTPQRSLRIVRAVAEALGHAHERGIVHRDIKPENILFTDVDRPVLADFGIVKRLGSETAITAVGTSVGTPYYMSPEQAQAIRVDTRSDIYSLGVVLFEMLNGAVPYDDTTTIGIALKHVNDPVPRLPGGLAIVQPLMERMMAKEPENRFQSAAELIAAVDELEARLSECADNPGQPSPPPARVRRAAAPPPAPDRAPKPTAPPPPRAAKKTVPPRVKSRAASVRPRNPETEFELMVLTPDAGAPALPAQPEPRATPPVDPTPPTPPVRRADPPAAKPPSPAPARPATDRPKRPQAPRRRVNTGRPPVLARPTGRWSRPPDPRPRKPWYRRPLSYLIGAVLAAAVVAALLIDWAAPDPGPSPVELVTGRGGPGAPLIGSVQSADAQPPVVTRTEPGSGESATPRPEAARAEFLDRMEQAETEPSETTSGDSRR